MARSADSAGHTGSPSDDRPALRGLTSGSDALRRSPALALWALFIVLFPFYVFPSGGLQPADFVMVPLLAYAALEPRLRLPPGCHAALVPLFGFVLYALLVNTTWALVQHNFDLSAEYGHILYGVFYAYNAAVFVTALLLFGRHGDDFLAATAVALLLSVLVQVAGSLVAPSGDELRETLFFNNPNQLGYYALLCATAFALLARSVALPTAIQGVFFAATAYLAVLSLSKAAMFAIAILAAVTFVTRLRALVATALVLIAADALLLSEANHLERVEYRVATTGHTSDDNLAGRGYDRVMNHPEHWFLGAGEGDGTRFDSALEGEIHSTFATVAFSYGIPGAVLFGLFLLGLVRRLDTRGLLLLVPAAFYGLTHNGLRFTIAWILLAVVLCVRLRSNASEESST